MRFRQLGLLLSSLGTLFVVGRLRFKLPLPLWIGLSLLVAYPIVLILSNQSSEQQLNVCYLFLLAISVGYLFAFWSHYPIGYSDTLYHLLESRSFLTEGISGAADSASLSFVGLYSLTTILHHVLGVSLPHTAVLIPGICLLTTIFIYYRYFSYEFLSSSTAQLLSVVLFLLNWGVFRFLIEYRTLVLAFPLGLLILGLLLKSARYQWYWSHAIAMISIILLTTLFITHFTSAVFFGMMIIVGIAWNFDRQSSGGWSRVLSIGLVLGFCYQAYLLSSFDATFLALFGNLYSIFADLIPSLNSVSSPAAKTSGFVGLTYGFRVFVAQWIIRFGFVVSALLFFISTIRSDNRQRWLLIIWGGVLALPLLGTVFFGFTLNPSRILIYLSIPYGVIFAWAYQYSTRGVNSSTIQKTASVTFVILILLAGISSGVKFPQYMAGNTEPIRGNQPIDENAGYSIRDSERQTATWVDSTGLDSLDIQYLEGRWPISSVNNTQDAKYGLYSHPQRGYSDGGLFTIENCSVIYASEQSFVGQCRDGPARLGSDHQREAG